MTTRLSILVLALTCGCARPSSDPQLPAPPTATSTLANATAGLSLTLRVVKNPRPEPDDPLAFQLTLARSSQSRGSVLVDSSLWVTVRFDLRGESGLLGRPCTGNPFANAGSYAYLRPGGSITRIRRLPCDRPPDGERVTARATYEDRDPPACPECACPPCDRPEDDPIRLPCEPSPCLTPEQVRHVFRGPLVSNAVEFVLR